MRLEPGTKILVRQSRPSDYSGAGDSVYYIPGYFQVFNFYGDYASVIYLTESGELSSTALSFVIVPIPEKPNLQAYGTVGNS